ncbi:MAG: hypothetical protein WC179_06885 [Candidatus Cloacimonadaceae bacterium]
MTVIEYMKRKNEILKEYIGIDFDLIPENQLAECEKIRLYDTSMGSCPYCLVYADNDCIECPMANAGNNCSDEKSTWSTYTGFCYITEIYPHNNILSPAYKPMVELIVQYNKELEED